MARLIPELNLKINFVGTSMTIPTAVGTGCHASTMSSVRLQLLPGNPFEWIDKDKVKAGQTLIKTGLYGEIALDPKIAEELAPFLAANPICADDHPTFAAEVVVKSQATPLWFLTDVVNRGSPARSNGGYGAVMEYGIVIPPIRTLQFAQYLIKNKIGYVLESPLIQNPMHRYNSDYSINQGWVWIPPEHAKRAIGQAQEHIGSEFPSEDQWVERVGKDVGIKTGAADVLKQVFADGRFPEPRFLTPQPKSARAV